VKLSRAEFDARGRAREVSVPKTSSVLIYTIDTHESEVFGSHSEANYLLIQDAEGVMDEVMDSLGLPGINHELVLFGWQDGAWQKVKSWPVPPDLDGLSCRCPGRT
jgi:hypothetical protein